MANRLVVDLSKAPGDPQRERIVRLKQSEVDARLAQKAAKEAARDAQSRTPLTVFVRRRAALEDFLFSKGYVSEREMTLADLAEFKAGLR